MNKEYRRFKHGNGEKMKLIKEPGTYCPGCGEQSVYCCDEAGDFYEGPGYVCRSCENMGVFWYAHEMEERDLISLREDAIWVDKASGGIS